MDCHKLQHFSQIEDMKSLSHSGSFFTNENYNIFSEVLADSDSSPLVWQKLQLICLAQIKIGGKTGGELLTNLQPLSPLSQIFKLYIGSDSCNSYNLSNWFSLNWEYCISGELSFRSGFLDVTNQPVFFNSPSDWNSKNTLDQIDLNTK